MRHGYLLSTLLLVAATAHAGVIINGTRLVYQGDKKESSLGLSNPDATDYLVQSWVDSGGKNQANAPFLITPPLFRLDAKEDNVLRVVRTGGNLPEDRESLYWLNIKAIPSSKHVEGVNTLQIAINTRIKLLYRPSAVKGRPEDVADKLEWHREGNDLVVNNPTPFYMNFQTVTLNGQKERVVNLNSLQHRMHDEFVAFEKMVATKDFDSVAKQLEHSRQVMEVLDQASKAL